MPPETKTCQNCQNSFIIEPEDFLFYEKIKVPPPTFCPECRLIRRMTWRNERSLFKRNCDKTGKEIITMFHPDAPVVVYDRDVWWSDGWDPTDYGQEYDFSKPFFEQYRELLEKVPLVNLANENCVGSPYGNNNADCKDCYLTYASFNNERVDYSFGSVGQKDCMDTYVGLNSESSCEDVLCGELYRTHFSNDSSASINSFFIAHCKNLQNCIGCVNLRNKNYCILNEQYSKEEYQEKKKLLDFGSYKNISSFKKIFEDFLLTFPNKFVNIVNCLDSTGDQMRNTKNVKHCFDIYDNVEDSKYLIHVLDMKDSYDVYGGGAGASLVYEGVDAGLQASRQLFSVFTHGCLDTQYTYMCFSSKNLFGCIGLRKKQYCILNKQYSREEYEVLLPKIIQHMNNVPYIDKKGRVYTYGEFFPSEISPFAYNETIAQEYFSRAKEELVKDGYRYRDPLEKDYQYTLKSVELPDHIKDAAEDILKEIIACPNGGDQKTQCTKAYRITKAELDFLKNNNIALPRYCPNCRHYQRLAQRNPFKLWHRACMCALKNHFHGDEHCKVEFETSYAPERSETIYCEKCYQQEVI
jgi:hypothetical protein